MIVINQGSANDNKIFLCTTDSDGSLGSTSITYTVVTPSNSGTVTSIATGTGIDGGTITSTGTLSIDSTVATLTGTQTFTNKTLTSPKINEDVAVTSTATELNILDGVTSTTAELNILDGVTSTTAELNILDGVTSTAAELNILDGVTSTAAELNILDGVTSTATELNKLDALSRGSIIYGNASAATTILTKGTANQLLTSDGTDIAWQDAAASGLEWQTIITGSTLTAVAGRAYWINTTSNTCTITLPSSASNGDQIILADYARTWGTNKIIIDSNGLNYQGEDDTFNVEYGINGQTINIVYSGATNGWIPLDDDVTEAPVVPPTQKLFLVWK